jgi:murein DD-endopeptidase MepM/ murein hydrolase activator NlpD
MKRILLYITFLYFSLGSYAQEIVSPLDVPLLLSGNFGELRNDHFHSGIDFKTQGVIGLPVKAVKQGFISRISVSPYGYGRAVYINHPDGTTSVYGHLDHFVGKVESAVRDSQYQKESFSVNLYFSPDEFPLEQGEFFAYSGNKGGSAGPHLHFEFRDTWSERAVDPLPYFKDRIKDNLPPDIREIMLFPQPGKGIVNGSAENQTITLIRDKSGKQALSKPVKACGNIGLGIKAYDKMSGTSNIYGVKEIILKVNGEEIYHSVMDGFSFDDTRYLNSFTDWKEWKENRSFFMKSFIEPGNYFDIYQSAHRGILPVSEEKTYSVEYILKDAYGNISTLAFDITGEKAAIPEEETGDIPFSCSQDNTYHGNGMDLNIPWKNLYTNVYLKIDTTSGYSPFAPLYSLGVKGPLHGYCPLTLDITNDVYPDKEKYGAVAVSGSRVSWLGGKYEDGKITVKIRELGQFSVVIDTIPPVVTPVSPAKWAANRRISFKISDNLSGIESYKGTLDGEFILFEYDAKTKSLFYEYDSKRMKKGNRQLNLVVTDGAGNKTVVEK